jgi:hypothetical protein
VLSPLISRLAEVPFVIDSSLITVVVDVVAGVVVVEVSFRNKVELEHNSVKSRDCENGPCASDEVI